MIILEDYPAVKLSFHELLAQRTFNKTVGINQIKSQKSEHPIKFFLENYEKQNQLYCSEKFLILDTQKEITNSTNLCVETVIRPLSEVNKLQKVDLVKRKYI